ncbi:hypothetical protein TSAR_016569 [Trichomalopsis sarcophagae]|uniref:Uncharacterized protein n=1 Tax=Trichomalopsis sarcophagae TaxID=543379 RepID=A0A232EUG5_9HYME|nr:hypothetical protein TSAR_016569 [Trichomalopsis sarcophagae]
MEDEEEQEEPPAVAMGMIRPSASAPSRLRNPSLVFGSSRRNASRTSIRTEAGPLVANRSAARAGCKIESWPKPSSKSGESLQSSLGCSRGYACTSSKSWSPIATGTLIVGRRISSSIIRRFDVCCTRYR